MQTQTVDGENPIYQAVAGLHADDLRARVAANAADMGIELNDEHLNVLQVLVNHYQEACQQHDCRAASPHMRYLIGHYAEHGGSSYLYRLFDGLDATQHVMTNPMVDIDGDSARCRMYMKAEHFLRNDMGSFDYAIGGYYTDELTKVEGRWLINAVTLKLFWQRGNRHIMQLAVARR